MSFVELEMTDAMSEAKDNRKPSRLDSLAAERSRLANERTFLAYQRTALTLFVAGVTFIHFFENLLIDIIGWAFIPAGLISVLLGVIRYRRSRARILQIDNKL
jgi:putative membrane protein